MNRESNPIALFSEKAAFGCEPPKETCGEVPLRAPALNRPSGAVGAGGLTLRYRRSMSARLRPGIRVVPRKQQHAFRPYLITGRGLFYFVYPNP